jgi:hypothetical protein
MFVIARKSPDDLQELRALVDLASVNDKCQISNDKWKMKFPAKLLPHCFTKMGVAHPHVA